MQAWESVAREAEGRVRARVLALVELAPARVLAREAEKRVRVQALVPVAQAATGQAQALAQVAVGEAGRAQAQAQAARGLVQAQA